MKVWVAQEVFWYEGANLIGAYSSETKAMQACQDAWKESNEGLLSWENGIAQGHNEHHKFEITECEVDA